MELTPKGSHAAQLGLQERAVLASELMDGRKDISDYTRQAVCYDAVAFVKFLLKREIQTTDLNDLIRIDGSGWKARFAFKLQWNGMSSIARGMAVGFKRLKGHTADPDKFFHAALAIGGTNMRGVNGGLLSPGWRTSVDLRKVLGNRNVDGSFNYDGTRIQVYLSSRS